MKPDAARQRLYALLGELPARKQRISAQKVAEEEHEGYRLERLVLDLNGREPVPALLTLPRSARAPYPVVLFNHSHGGFYRLGKRELVEGNVYLVDPPYAEALAARGIAALCIDQLNFGERHQRNESELYKELIWRGQVLWGLMVYDSLRAIDYLTTRRDIDPERIAALGISMGSTMSYWIAALDERVRVVVELCCLTDYDELIAARGLDEHGIYYYVPGLLREFDTARLLELLAPRPFLSLAGNQDPLTPPRGLDKLDAFMKKTYRARGKPGNWRMLREDHAHFESHTMRAAALGWLDRHLLNASGKIE
jgi:dienelactone hydrolase